MLSSTDDLSALFQAEAASPPPPSCVTSDLDRMPLVEWVLNVSRQGGEGRVQRARFAFLGGKHPLNENDPNPHQPTHTPSHHTQACHYHGFSMATASRAVCLADAAAAAIADGAPTTHAARALPPPLRAVAALTIAAKRDEAGLPNDVSRVQACGSVLPWRGGAFDAQTVTAAELALLHALDWRTSAPTPADFAGGALALAVEACGGGVCAPPAAATAAVDAALSAAALDPSLSAAAASIVGVAAALVGLASIGADAGALAPLAPPAAHAAAAALAVRVGAPAPTPAAPARANRPVSAACRDTGRAASPASVLDGAPPSPASTAASEEEGCGEGGAAPFYGAGWPGNADVAAALYA